MSFAPIFAGFGSGGGADLKPSDVLTASPTSGTTVEFELGTDMVQHDLVFSGLELSGAADIVIELYETGVGWQQGAAAYRNNRTIKTATGAITNSNRAYFSAVEYDGTNAINAQYKITCAAIEVPTIIEGRYWWNASPDKAGRHWGRINDTAIYEKVRVRINGAQTFDGGEIQLQRKGGEYSVSEYDFSEASSSQEDFTIPAGTWLTEVIGYNLVTSTSVQSYVRLDAVSTSTYRRMYHSAGGDATSWLNHFKVDLDGTSSNHDPYCKLYGAGLEAPTVFSMLDMRARQIQYGFLVEATAHTSVRFFNSGASNFTSGQVYVVHHIRPSAVLDSHDCGAASISGLEVTDISANSICVVWPYGDFSNNDEVEITPSEDNGSTWETGTEYTAAWQNRSSDPTVVDTTELAQTFYDNAQAMFCTTIEGMPLADALTVAETGNCESSSPKHNASFRTVAAAENALQIKSRDNSRNLVNGVLYVMGAT